MLPGATEDGIESRRKQEAARRTALPYAPGHEELSSGRSCKFHVRGAVVVDPSQEAADELRQLCLFQRVENPNVIDARKRGSKISQKDT